MQILEPSSKATAGFAPRLPGPTDIGFQISSENPRWQLAMRIASSGSLGRSQLLSDFLLYIVDRSIRGRTDLITEQQIGVIVFGRTEDYDSSDDNIVRSYARKLRKRIDEYFATEGQNESLRIEIPRGGYAPIFSEYTAAQLQAEIPAITTNEVLSQDLGNTQPAEIDSTKSSSAPTPDIWLRIIRKMSSGVLVALFAGLILGVGATLLLSKRPPRARMQHPMISGNSSSARIATRLLFRPMMASSSCNDSWCALWRYLLMSMGPIELNSKRTTCPMPRRFSSWEIAAIPM